MRGKRRNNWNLFVKIKSHIKSTFIFLYNKKPHGSMSNHLNAASICIILYLWIHIWLTVHIPLKTKSSLRENGQVLSSRESSRRLTRLQSQIQMLPKASSIALLLLSSILHPPALPPLSARSFIISSSSAAYPSGPTPTGIGCGAIPVGRGCPPGTVGA